MVIEWLKFQVDYQLREKFISQDQEIWTTALAQFPGYLGKEVWINPQKPEEIVLVIRWASREQWGAVPQALLDETEAKFLHAMGANTYKMIETGEYQVRKFANY